MNETVLLTGGAGYFGAHVAVALLEAGARVVAIDAPGSGTPDAAERIARVAGRPLRLLRAGPDEGALLDDLIAEEAPQAAIHLAPDDPAPLAAALRRHGVARLVLVGPQDGSGDAVAVPGLAVLALRIATLAGAHPSGTLAAPSEGDDLPLFPAIARAASGMDERLRVFGDDYPTRDGSPVRDFVHVADAARAIPLALAALAAGTAPPPRGVEIGRGRGVTVLEALAAFRRVVGREIPFRVTGRRPGDQAERIADPGPALRLFGWRPTLGLDEMCADQWRLQRRLLDAPG